jgi:hypothetical protein
MEQKLRSPFGSSGSTAPSASSQPSSSSSMGPAGLPFEARTGSDTPPHVTFKEVDPFDLWVWLEFVVPPAQREKELLQSTLKSWFVVGKLGGFNSQNMQVCSADMLWLGVLRAGAALGSEYPKHIDTCSGFCQLRAFYSHPLLRFLVNWCDVVYPQACALHPFECTVSVVHVGGGFFVRGLGGAGGGGGGLSFCRLTAVPC